MSARPQGARWTGYRPTVPPVPSDRRRFGGTLFDIATDEAAEVRFSIPAQHHLVCAHLSGSIDWSAECDERRYRRPCLADTVCIAPAGETPRVVYRNAHASFVHLYLPPISSPVM